MLIGFPGCFGEVGITAGRVVCLHTVADFDGGSDIKVVL